MNEMLCGIRVLKFYAWENIFTDRINELRGKELQSLKGRKYLDALCVYFWATTPVLISILTFTTYALLGHQLTAAKVNLPSVWFCSLDLDLSVPGCLPACLPVCLSFCLSVPVCLSVFLSGWFCPFISPLYNRHG